MFKCSPAPRLRLQPSFLMYLCVYVFVIYLYMYLMCLCIYYLQVISILLQPRSLPYMLGSYILLLDIFCASNRHLKLNMTNRKLLSPPHPNLLMVHLEPLIQKSHLSSLSPPHLHIYQYVLTSIQDFPNLTASYQLLY